MKFPLKIDKREPTSEAVVRDATGRMVAAFWGPDGEAVHNATMFVDAALCEEAEGRAEAPVTGGWIRGDGI